MTFIQLTNDIKTMLPDVDFMRDNDTTIRFFYTSSGDKDRIIEFVNTRGGVITSHPNYYCIISEFAIDDGEAKSYKEFESVFIGDSDISALTVRTVGGVFDLRFGGDAAYYAYLCEGNVVIGEHYRAVFDGEVWLTIYDDSGLALKLREHGGYRHFTIYRAGEYGCIIHWHKEPRV
ncbi:MAG: hypothetical protein IKT56_02765 [Clostridia bacterium]|nr:hypothetical protein [Clostridia bacterium]